MQYLKYYNLKFLLYLVYFYRSATLRGFINTLRLLKAELRFEKKFGIKTSTIKRSASDEFFHYQGAGYLILIRLFNLMAPHTKKFRFLDIGSGKGRAVFVAEYCGYEHLIGIELDNKLTEEARQNATRYVPRNKISEIQFITDNALTYNYINEPSVYFLFNPFNSNVLMRVLEKIRASTKSETWFIYMNPLFRQNFENQNSQLVAEIKTSHYLEAVIYKWPKSEA